MRQSPYVPTLEEYNELRAKVAYLEEGGAVHMQLYRETEAQLKQALAFLEDVFNSKENDAPHKWWCPTTNYNYGNHEAECTCWVKDVRAFLQETQK